MSFRAVPSPDLIVSHIAVGSACCVWRDGLRSYVLSAAHVVANLPEGTPVQWLSGNAIGLGTTLPVTLSFIQANGGVLDAALIEIKNIGPFQNPTDYPWGTPVMPRSLLATVRSVVICGKFGQVFATFAGVIAAGRVLDGRRYGPLLKFRYDSPNPTLRGDSGAPVISLPEGMLVGMHLGKDADNQHSLGVAAHDILDAFGSQLPGFQLRP